MPPLASHDAEPASDRCDRTLASSARARARARSDFAGHESPQSGEQRVRDVVERLQGAFTGEALLDMPGQSARARAAGRSPTTNRSSSARSGQSVRSMARPPGSLGLLSGHDTRDDSGSPHSSWRPILIIVDGGSLDHQQVPAPDCDHDPRRRDRARAAKARRHRARPRAACWNA